MAAAGSNDGLWDWDLGADLFYVSDRWKLMIGLSAADRIERSEQWFRDVHQDDLPGLRAELARHLDGDTPHFEHEYRMQHLDGSPRWVLCRGIAVRDETGKPTRIAGSQTDVTMRRRVQDDLAHAALHDDLTGLANRMLFTAMLDRSLARAQRAQNYQFAVLFVDLDHFKLVNDSLGHVAGDKFLVAMAKRFLKQMRPGDLLARLGGDEFAVLLDDMPDVATANTIAERLQLALLEAFEIDGRDFYASASMGIAVGNNGYLKSEDLLRDADAAMYHAKSLGRARCQTFDPSMHASALQRLTIETRLRRAVERQELSLEYPADCLPRRARRLWIRSARQVETRGRDDDAAFGVHPDRRRNRPDWADDPLGSEGIVPAGGGVAARVGSSRRRDGEHLGEAVRPVDARR